MRKFFNSLLLLLCCIMLVGCTSNNSGTLEENNTQVGSSSDIASEQIAIYSKFSEDNGEKNKKYTMMSTITLDSKGGNVTNQHNVYVASPVDSDITGDEIKSNIESELQSENIADISGVTYKFDLQEEDVILAIEIDYSEVDFEKFKAVSNLYLAGDTEQDVPLSECESKLKQEDFIKRS